MSIQNDLSNKKFSLTFGQWSFSPSLKLSIITLIIISICISLGIWQLSRSAQKQQMQTIIKNRMYSTPTAINILKDPTDPENLYAPIAIDGVFINHYTFLLDNQVLEHQAGYRILTPFQAPDHDKWILIDRGWVAAGADRNKLPEIENIYGVKHINGLINKITPGLVLKPDNVQDNPSWPILIQTIDYNLISQQLKHPVYEVIVQMQSSDILNHPIMPIEIGLSSSKHFAYAMQWFIFAILGLIYFIIISTKRII